MDHIGSYRRLILQSHGSLNCGVSQISQTVLDTKELQILEETLLTWLSNTVL